MQNLSPKDIAGYVIMKLKVSQCVYASLVGIGKGLNTGQVYSLDWPLTTAPTVDLTST